MIRITKPAPPAVLLSRGPQETQRLCAAFATDPTPFINGKVKFKRSIYAHRAVRRALVSAQFGKCAFCESLLTAVAYGDVEHYRPKAGFKQHKGDPLLTQPGYYWLAYDWEHLVYSCQICNQTHKANHFPLQNPSHRASPATRDITNERPLLVNPAADDPERFIEFAAEVARPVGNRRVGKVTIEVLGLNRPELLEKRRRHLQVVLTFLRSRDYLRQERSARTLTQVEQQLLARYEQALSDWGQESSEFAAMTRALLG